MYSYIIGEDEHFDLEWCKNRKDAEESLELMLFLYEICYTLDNAEFGVITDREFYKKFDEKYHSSKRVRRLGNKLLMRIEELTKRKIR
jgi:hypothetical protein